MWNKTVWAESRTCLPGRNQVRGVASRYFKKGDQNRYLLKVESEENYRTPERFLIESKKERNAD